MQYCVCVCWGIYIYAYFLYTIVSNLFLLRPFLSQYCVDLMIDCVQGVLKTQYKRFISISINYLLKEKLCSKTHVLFTSIEDTMRAGVDWWSVFLYGNNLQHSTLYTVEIEGIKLPINRRDRHFILNWSCNCNNWMNRQTKNGLLYTFCLWRYEEICLQFFFLVSRVNFCCFH